MIGMDRVTGIVGSTKRDKNGNRDRVGCRTQGKGRKSEAFCPTEDLFARVGESLVCDDITFVYWVSKGPSTPVG